MQIESILHSAFTQPVAAERPIGCCRVYVSIADATAAKSVEKAAKKIGKIFQKKGHYGTRNVLYVGYDNCNGRDLARATAIVAALTAAGIKCYREEHGD